MTYEEAARLRQEGWQWVPEQTYAGWGGLGPITIPGSWQKTSPAEAGYDAEGIYYSTNAGVGAPLTRTDVGAPPVLDLKTIASIAPNAFIAGIGRNGETVWGGITPDSPEMDQLLSLSYEPITLLNPDSIGMVEGNVAGNDGVYPYTTFSPDGPVGSGGWRATTGYTLPKQSIKGSQWVGMGIMTLMGAMGGEMVAAEAAYNAAAISSNMAEGMTYAEALKDVMNTSGSVLPSAAAGAMDPNLIDTAGAGLDPNATITASNSGDMTTLTGGEEFALDTATGFDEFNMNPDVGNTTINNGVDLSNYNPDKLGATEYAKYTDLVNKPAAAWTTADKLFAASLGIGAAGTINTIANSGKDKATTINTSSVPTPVGGSTARFPGTDKPVGPAVLDDFLNKYFGFDKTSPGMQQLLTDSQNNTIKYNTDFVDTKGKLTGDMLDTYRTEGTNYGDILNKSIADSQSGTGNFTPFKWGYSRGGQTTAMPSFVPKQSLLLDKTINDNALQRYGLNTGTADKIYGAKLGLAGDERLLGIANDPTTASRAYYADLFEKAKWANPTGTNSTSTTTSPGPDPFATAANFTGTMADLYSKLYNQRQPTMNFYSGTPPA